MGNLFGDRKFTDAVPAGLRLLGFAAAQPGFSHLRTEFFQRDMLLAAFAGQAEERTENLQREPRNNPASSMNPTAKLKLPPLAWRRESIRVAFTLPLH